MNKHRPDPATDTALDAVQQEDSLSRDDHVPREPSIWLENALSIQHKRMNVIQDLQRETDWDFCWKEFVYIARLEAATSGVRSGETSTFPQQYSSSIKWERFQRRKIKAKMSYSCERMVFLGYNDVIKTSWMIFLQLLSELKTSDSWLWIKISTLTIVLTCRVLSENSYPFRREIFHCNEIFHYNKINPNIFIQPNKTSVRSSPLTRSAKVDLQLILSNWGLSLSIWQDVSW